MPSWRFSRHGSFSFRCFKASSGDLLFTIFMSSLKTGTLKSSTSAGKGMR